MSSLNNLHIIEDMDEVHELYRGRHIHVTNGVYSAPAQLIVPTTLAGFQFVADQKICRKHDAFVIGINSDVSYLKLMFAKGANDDELSAMEDQNVRALKIAEPLAIQHPDRVIAVTFFHEPTPNAMFDRFVEDGLQRVSLHKWGYGTTPNAPKIEGAEHFETVFGLPLPNDIKPFAHDITARENQPSVKIVKLTETFGKHGAPYISSDGKVLFPVKPGLEKYAQKYEGAVMDRPERFISTTSAGLSIVNPPKPEQP